MGQLLIHSATIVNQGQSYKASVLINGSRIEAIFDDNRKKHTNANTYDATGMHLLPGVVDDQVHFREPGLDHKANIYSESKAAVAGGITSFMEMPNTSPQTTTQQRLAEKYEIGAAKSIANYSFYMGATNDNIDELLKTDPRTVCGIKVFMGSSTGNMLVDKAESLEAIFSQCKMLIATHCEDETTIQANTKAYKAKYGNNMPIAHHADIRDDKSCYLSSSKAVAIARKHNTRLHVLHLSSALEMPLFNNKLPAAQKRITAEVCVHHLWFDSADYQQHGTRIKWNPAIKHQADKEALWQALLDNKLDVIATDHAPHTIDEKDNSYFEAPSGGPLVQHSLVAMLQQSKQGRISIEQLVDKMCHKPAEIFQLAQRGYIRQGYYADLVLVKLNSPWEVHKNNLHYKCAWSPFEGQTFDAQVISTFVSGHRAYHKGQFDESQKGMRLIFDR